MESTMKTFQIMNDVEFVLQFDSLSESEYFCDIGVGSITFEKVNETLKKKPEVYQVAELKSLQEIFQDHTNRRPNRTFAELSLKPQFVEDQSAMLLHYIVNLNQNLVKSLGASGITELQIYLRCYMEEQRLGKWCLWDSTPNSCYNFTLSVAGVKGAFSDWSTLQLSEKIDKEVDAIDLIQQGKETLRIRFNLNISVNHLKNATVNQNQIGKMSSKTTKSLQPSRIKLKELSILKSLYENDYSKDITITVGNQVAVKAHKFILTAQSSVFEALLNSKMKEQISGIIRLEDIGEVAMNLLVQYLYGMEILDLNCETACELFQAAHKYKLPQLEASIASVFLFRDEKWFTADIALELYFYTKNIFGYKNLNDHLLKVLSRIPSTKLRNSPKFQELSEVDVVDLTFKLNDALNLK